MPSAVVVRCYVQGLAFAIIIFGACGGGQMTGIYVWVQTSHFHREKIHSTKNWRLEFEELLLTKLPKQAKMVNRIFSRKTFQEKQPFP